MGQINLKNIIPVFYENGVESLNTYIGRFYSNNSVYNYTCKFTFISPETGGSSFKFSWQPEEVNKLTGDYFYYITTKDNLINRNIPHKNTGKLISQQLDEVYTFSAEKEYNFMPNTVYFLYIYTINENLVTFGSVDASTNFAFIDINGEVISKIYGSNGTLGQPHLLQLNKILDNYQYEVVLKCYQEEIILSIPAGQEKIEWVPPISWAAFQINNNKLEVTATLKNYSNGALVGEFDYILFFKIPDSVRQQVNFLIAKVQEEHDFIIQNQTQLQIIPQFEGDSGFGAVITEYVFQCGDSYYRGENPIFVLPFAGQNRIIGYASDSRGRIYNFDLTEEALEYSPPSVEITSIYRCDADGYSDFTGENVQISYNYAISSLNNTNTAFLEFYILDLEDNITRIYQVESQQEKVIIESNNQIIEGFDVTKRYKIYAKITDIFSSGISNSIYISNNEPVVDIRKNTKSIGLFHRASKAGAIISGVPIKLTQEPMEDDEVITKGFLENKIRPMTVELSNLNWKENKQIVDIENLSSTDIVIISPTPVRANLKEYISCNVICMDQLKNQLVFECDIQPSIPVSVNIYIYSYVLRVDTMFIDFEYIINDDGTYTLTEWKHTLNGELSNRMIIPTNELITI